MSARHFTVWQCRDWCCEDKPHRVRWWNVSIAPGNYDSVPTFYEALRVVAKGKLRWE